MEALEEFLSSPHLFSRSGILSDHPLDCQTSILQPIINSLAEGLLVTNASGKIVLFNEAATKLLKDQIEHLPEDISRAMKAETSQIQKVFLDDRIVEMSARPIRDARGKFYGSVAIFRDITKPKILQEKLETLATIVESSSDGIVSGDLTGTIRTWNKGAEKILGYSESEMIGRTPSILFPNAETEQRFKMSLDLVFTGHGDSHYESWHRRKDGKKILLSISVSSVRNEAGEIAGGCAILRDITELRKSQEEVKALARNLARSNEELKQFAYAASHDLQEPLRGVTSYLTLLSDRYADHLDGDAREFIGFAVDGVSRMRQLIEALLEYSGIEGPTAQFSSVDSMALLEKIKSTMKVSIDEVKAELVVDHLPMVFADEIRLSQVFQKLIGNAIKFCGTKAPKIFISAQWVEGEWIFSVKDFGIGIDPRQSHRIFQIFQKLHHRTEYPGTGIGLAICKKIVEQHGGRIWFDSIPGKETTFSFSLPGKQRQGTA